MPVASFLALFDDIATVLDDVATMTKVATQKTAGVLGDDLALNAEQVTGVRPARELPVVFAVARGSALNKVILIPAALAVSAVAPWAITPLLMLGGAFLCFEGFEKVAHKILHPEREKDEHVRHAEAVADESVDLVALEKQKIKGAIRTDFILSAEIVVIVLGTVAEVEFVTRIGVLVAVAVLMTVGVYGLVALIVKLDDIGAALVARGGSWEGLGEGILWAAPVIMRLLGVLGTAAMFLVGGGILAHGIPALHHALEALPHEGVAGFVVPTLANGVVGIVAGGLLVGLFTVVRRVRSGASG